MTSLLQVRDALALHGNVQAQKLSRLLGALAPLVQAMLQRLTAKGQGCSTVVYRVN